MIKRETCLLGLLLVLVTLVFAGCGITEVHRDLIAFSGGSQISGNFFLLTGSLGSRYTYRYLYKTKTGGIKQDMCLIRQAEISEDDTKNPRLIISHDSSRACGDKHGTNLACYHKFVLPKGSVKSEYELDIGKQ